jgi:hypothetical protein
MDFYTPVRELALDLMCFPEKKIVSINPPSHLICEAKLLGSEDCIIFCEVRDISLFLCDHCLRPSKTKHDATVREYPHLPSVRSLVAHCSTALLYFIGVMVSS